MGNIYRVSGVSVQVSGMKITDGVKYQGRARVQGYGKTKVRSAERGSRVTVWMFTVLSMTSLCVF